MRVTLEHLPCPDSPIRRLDPRWKLAALLVAAAVAACLRSLPAMLLALAGAQILTVVSRLPFRWLTIRLGSLALFVALFTLPLPLLLGEDGPAWQVGPVRFSQRGVGVALLLSAKAVTVVALMLVLLATAPLDSTLKAAHSLRVPSLLIQLSLLSYRYVFLAADELARLRVALRVRGYRNRADRHSYRTVGHVAGTLLVRSFERSERVGQAMRCRGFDGRFRSFAEFTTRPADVGFFVLVAGSAAILFALSL
jgi:cobalt/nickel transport system permease protein